MKWRIGVGGPGTVDHSVEPLGLGLTLAEGKKTLAGLQRHLVQAQTEEIVATDDAARAAGLNVR